MTIKHIIDTTGRRGLITEDRGTGFFARPESMVAAVGFASGKLITAKLDDGRQAELVRQAIDAYEAKR